MNSLAVVVASNGTASSLPNTGLMVLGYSILGIVVLAALFSVYKSSKKKA